MPAEVNLYLRAEDRNAIVFVIKSTKSHHEVQEVTSFIFYQSAYCADWAVRRVSAIEERSWLRCNLRVVAFGRLLLPYIVGSNAVPVVAVAPLVVLWFGHGLLSKVIVSAFLCFFPLSMNTYKGLSETPPLLRDLFDVYGGTRLQFLMKARLPFAAPYVFTGLKLNATYAVIGAIVAEFIGATSGLGFGMLNAIYSLDIPRLWGYLVVSVLLGMSAYALIWIAEKFVIGTIRL